MNTFSRVKIAMAMTAIATGGAAAVWGAIPEGSVGAPAAQTPAAQAPTSNAPQSARAVNPDLRKRSDALLIQARRALAAGDVGQARKLAAQAKELGAIYQLLEDSPTRVEALAAKIESLERRRPREAETDGFRRSQAELQMEQAEALLAWRDFDTAEQLAAAADRAALPRGPFEAQPADLLKRIAAARQGQAPSAARSVASRLGGEAAPASPKDQAVRLTASARAALAAGNLAEAARLAQSAAELRVPDSAFAANEDRPALVLFDLRKAQAARNPGRPAQGAVQTSFESPAEDEVATTGAPDLSRDYDAPIETTSDAPVAAAPRIARAPATSSTAAVEQVPPPTTVADRKLLTDVADKEVEAKRILTAEPIRARELVKEAQAMVEESAVNGELKERVAGRLSRTMADVEKHIRDNRSRIELDERNQAVLQEIDRERDEKYKSQQELAALIEQYNKLQDEQRHEEAEVIAKRAAALAPDDPVAVQLVTTSKLIRNLARAKDIRDRKEKGFIDELIDVDQASIGMNSDAPIQFPSAQEWNDLSNRRRKQDQNGRKRSEREIEIEQKLKTPVPVQFQDQPLSLVLETLGELAKLNIHLDMRGLSEEGVTTDTPVSIMLKDPVELRSALNLILRPLRLSYLVKNEVLNVTSKQFRSGEVYPVTYNVGDLVIAIPNFVPNGRSGMSGALQDAYNTLGYGGGGGAGSNRGPLSVVATRDGGPSSATNPAVLANMPGLSPGGGALPDGKTAPAGPGGMGGAPRPDFETLIELITSTVAPQSWDEVGGPGTIERFPLNLSLVISQTQDVHEQIVDLLNQLRRLQDLQVAIEVKFITLSDNFFERIGISLDFNINSRVDRPFQIFGRSDETIPTAFQDAPFTINQGVMRDVTDRNLTRSNSVIAGLGAPGVFSADLDIPVTTGGSFTSAVPQFGGFDATTAASTGFAILSDIETYFFMTAAQGDRRSNVLQAPKVTLFNGQSAVVSDQSFSPFVISVIPVVGDFAAAQQPVIMILPEGTNLTVQAVVSNDRRFVRLTVVPYFSNIEKVDTFRFTGTTSTRVNTSTEGPDDNPTNNQNSTEVFTEGTTVQLPTLAVVTVTTTVSVPDGGTVLLGGVKRLREGRNEFGVPFLNKIPYVKRLFSNVGIGRETSSLMLMVTPRIIIQEEEESLLGITPQQP